MRRIAVASASYRKTSVDIRVVKFHFSLDLPAFFVTSSRSVASQKKVGAHDHSLWVRRPQSSAASLYK
jgi:hypothetical protein